MSDVVISVIRTWVPVAVGLGLATAGRTLGVVIPEDASATVASVATALATAAWYALVRWAETRWPAAGWLLGVRRRPHY